MENKTIGIRIHDIHHGLILGTGALVETELSLMKELGAATQIATTIKDHEIIENINTLYAAAGELKIPKTLTDVALKHLEKLDFVRLKLDVNHNITRIDVTIPKYSKIYNDIGDYFKNENSSKLAFNTISTLNKVSMFPHKEKDIISELKISTDEYDCIKDLGKNCSFLDTYRSPKDSESILFSPLHWDDNPSNIFELLRKHSSIELSTTIKSIQKYQGLPGDNISNEILFDAIKLGCFPTLSVDSTTGLKKFVFTPQLGISHEEKTLLHKARVLLSCVRYGENFAGITKIHSPERLIEVLAGRGYLEEHTESLKQYESARNLGLVKIIPSGFNRHEVHFIDNDENKKAVDLAIQMLQVGETAKIDNSIGIAKSILLPSALKHPTQTRFHLLKNKPSNRSQSTLHKINDLLRGVDID
jgi:hypothetical protein